METEKNCKTFGCYYNPINTAPPWSQATYSSEKRTVSRAKINALRTTSSYRPLWDHASILLLPEIVATLQSSPFGREKF